MPDRQRMTAQALRDMDLFNGGLRQDGTWKGEGWLGPIHSGEGYGTEYSRGEPGNKYEDEHFGPTLVPTLTDKEIEMMGHDIMPHGLPLPNSITKKAELWARQRLAAGKSPFYDPKKDGIMMQMRGPWNG